jgi:hypothetical protein
VLSDEADVADKVWRPSHCLCCETKIAVVLLLLLSNKKDKPKSLIDVQNKACQKAAMPGIKIWASSSTGKCSAVL